MNFEEALIILDAALQPKFLNNIQELVFRQAWAGQTYSEMASTSGYDVNYIKNVGYKLWHLLSKTFNESVTKSNFQSVLRRQYIAYKHAWRSSNVSEGESPSVYTEDSVSVPISVSASPRRSVSIASASGEVKCQPQALALASGNEIASPQKVVSVQQIEESRQPPVVNTVLATPVNVEKLNINTQNTKPNLLRATPNFVDTKVSTANTASDWSEAINVLASSGCTEELNTLKQWIVDARYQLVVLFLGKEDITG